MVRSACKYFDRVTEQLYKTLEQKLPGYDVYITSANRNEDVFIVRTITDRSLGSFSKCAKVTT